MTQLDELELGKTLGRVEQKVDSLIISFSEYKKKADDDFAEHDRHIEVLLEEKAERRGKSIVWGSVAGFSAFVISKVIEHAPALIKSIIG